jgi:hypothetical protein
MVTPPLTLREQALARLTEALGPPRALSAEPDMAFYRWILSRSDGMSLYLTLNSPELTDIAHLLLSDPRQAVEPVVSLTIRTIPEVDAAIERIIRQWRAPASAP